MSLQRKQSQPQLVLDSVPFGSDGMETQPGFQPDLDQLAKEFEGMQVEVPTAPIVT